MGTLELKWRIFSSGGQMGKQLVRYLIGIQFIAVIIMLSSQIIISIPIGNEQNEIIQLGKISGELSQLQIAMDDQETGLRGYELTGEKDFLAPFYSGVNNYAMAVKQLTAVKHIISIDPFVKSTIKLGLTWNARFAIPMINLRHNNKKIPLVMQNQAKTTFDAFRREYAIALGQVNNRIHFNDVNLRVLSAISLVIYALIASSVMAMVTLLLSRQLRKWVEPIITLTQAVERYTHGDLHYPVPVIHDKTELGRLSLGIETMRIALQQQFRSIENMALQDGLTGIWNRRYFDERLAFDVRDANVSATHQFCLLMCDIDYFKAVNDTYGHQEGDRVLQEVAERLQQNIRRGDVLARYGGEEFVIIAYMDIRHALDYAERIRLSVRFVTVQDQRVSISVGVSWYQQGEPPNLVLKRADDALYKAKQSGRNRVDYIA